MMKQKATKEPATKIPARSALEQTTPCDAWKWNGYKLPAPELCIQAAFWAFLFCIISLLSLSSTHDKTVPEAVTNIFFTMLECGFATLYFSGIAWTLNELFPQYWAKE
ncbi:unnamed protein product, partial [Mesorhabditis spiculigera]